MRPGGTSRPYCRATGNDAGVGLLARRSPLSEGLGPVGEADPAMRLGGGPASGHSEAGPAE